MTQCEVDARRAQINKRFDEQRYQINCEFQRRRQAVLDKINELRNKYYEAVQASQVELNKLLTERLELKRQGFEPYNPQMDSSFIREREIHAVNRTRKAQLEMAIYQSRKDLSDVQMWQQAEHKDLRQWRDAEQARLYQEYSKAQSINQSISKPGRCLCKSIAA